MNIKKILKRILIIAIVLFIAFNTIAYIQAYRFTHFSTKDIEKSSSDNDFIKSLKMLLTGVDNPRPENSQTPEVDYETITIQSNVKLECWEIQANDSKGTIILFHGYTDSKSSMLERAYLLRDIGYNTLLIDFMGSGGSEGSVTTIGYYEAENVKSAYDYVLDKGENNITLLGTSMGAAAILKAINDYEIFPQAIIIECPFASMIETISIRFKLMGLPPTPTAQTLAFWGGLQNGFNAFSMNPAEFAKQVEIPALLIYGANDEKVTMAETQRIYNNLNGDKKLLIFSNSGHADYLKNEKVMWNEEVNSFLKNIE